MQDPETLLSSSPQQSDVVLQPLPPEDWPSIDHIITEDGAPVDNVFSEKQMRLLTEPLYSSWTTDRLFVALSNVGLFYGVDLPPLVPDMLLSMNVRLPENLFPKLHRSYFVWKYGKPPEVAIEVVSNRRGGEDTDKVLRYADIRVANYFIFDPERHLSDQPLRAFRLQGSKMVADTSGSFIVPEVGLALTLWEGNFESTDASWLRWCDEQGELVRTGAESAKLEKQRADSLATSAQIAQQQAREAHEQARSAEQQAGQQKERADILATEKAALIALLQKNGIDPNSLG